MGQTWCELTVLFESLDLTEKQLPTHVSRKYILNSYGMDLVEKPMYYILAVHHDDVSQLCVFFQYSYTG